MIVVVAAVVEIVEVLILVEEAGLKFLSHPKCAIYINLRSRGWKTGLEETCHKNRKKLLIQSYLPVKLVRWPTQ